MTQNIGHLFKIVSKKSHMELALSTDHQTMGVAVLRQPSLNSANSFWIQYQQTHHIIRSELNLQCLSVYENSKQAGALIVTLPYFNAECQKFYLKRMYQQNQFVIVTFCGLVLSCYQQQTREGTLITQEHENDRSHQLWYIQPI